MATGNLHGDLCAALGIEYPLFAFSHCRDVVAAVTNAGGMGVLGALVFTPDQLEMELEWIDDHVDGKPYGVDVVMPVTSADRKAGLGGDDLVAQLNSMIPEGHRTFAAEILERYGSPGAEVTSGDREVDQGVLGWTESTGRPLTEIALAHDISFLASALGPPSKDVIDQAHENGVTVGALVGSPTQAERDVQLGVDVIIAQGWEAGGHTGDIASMILIPEVVEAVGPTPVLAAGGIGSGKQMAATMALGASGVWTGSIWLTVAESDTPEAVQRELLTTDSRGTVRSRALTGKPARQLRNAWTEAWDDPSTPEPLPMPLQFMLSHAALRQMQRDDTGSELAVMPVGQIVGSMNHIRTAREVVMDIITEYVDTVDEMHNRLSGTTV